MAKRYAETITTPTGEPVYDHAGPELLIEQSPLAPPDPDEPKRKAKDWIDMKSHLEARLTMMRSWRFSWIQHWALIAQYLQPRRSLWLSEGGVDQPVPNSMVRGLPINQAILDPTGTYALQVAAAGMMSGLMSPSRPWFDLGLPNDDEPADDAKIWFETVKTRIYAVMAHSNFYDSMAQMFEDLVAFGTAPVIMYEDEKDLVRCQNPVVGEYYLGVGASFRVETFYRQFVLTVIQMVEMFGLKNVPQNVKTLWMQKGASLEQEFIIAHAIEPNFPLQRVGDPRPYGVVPGGFTYREVFWVWGVTADHPLSIRGFHDFPFISPRWWVTANDPYGRGPAMTALGDIMQLQVETRRKAELLEKVVRPPLVASIELKNQPTSIAPGGISYAVDPSKGMKPIFEVNPQGLPGITADLKEIQERIKVGFFNDLFLMLVQSRKDETAFEVAQKQQEKLQVLGPVIERFQNEGAGPAIMRIFNILKRKGAIPPLPPSLQGTNIEIKYISMLALAQKAVATAGLERLTGFIGNLAGAKPQILEIYDEEEAVREYAAMMGTKSKVLRTPAEYKKRIDAMQQQAAQAKDEAQGAATATHIAPAVTDAAKNLADTNVGGGASALSLMLGNSSGSALQ